MSARDWTPGPWEAVTRYPGFVVVDDACGFGIARMYRRAHQTQNAHLMAAAPALYEALAGLLRHDEWMVNIGGTEGPLPQSVIEEAAKRRIPLIDAARAALAQAEGIAA